MASTGIISPNPLTLNHPTSSHSFGKVCFPSNNNVNTNSSSSSSSSSRKSVITSFVTSSPSLSSNSMAPVDFSTSRAFADAATARASLAELWREVQGCNNWEDLVEPLHPLLRKEIIRYGEFVTACYKGFELETSSARYLTCKYGKKSMLKEVGMGNSGYEVTKYIYAAPEINIPIQPEASCSRWIGYVAVATDENEIRRLGRRDIVITFRGTVTNHEWMANLMSSLTPARLDPTDPRPDVQVESGFLSLYTSDESNNRFGLKSCREQLLSEVSRLLQKHKGEKLSISLAGHSMGSSLALLLAYDIAELGINKNNSQENNDREVPLTVFSFGGPRVGNWGFKKRCEELGVKVLRIVNVNDPITKLPGVFLNENYFRVGLPWMSCSCYAHVGVELLLDFFNMQNPTCVHDLESYISLLRCPPKQEEERGFLKGAMGNFVSQSFDRMMPLKEAATNMVNLVQSSEILLVNDNLLMNSLAALYIFL